MLKSSSNSLDGYCQGLENIAIPLVMLVLKCASGSVERCNENSQNQYSRVYCLLRRDNPLVTDVPFFCDFEAYRVETESEVLAHRLPFFLFSTLVYPMRDLKEHKAVLAQYLRRSVRFLRFENGHPAKVMIWLCAAVLLVGGEAQLIGQTRQDCLSCHSDPELAAERSGKQMSLHVDEKALNSSVHGRFVCVACHAGFKPDEMPHREKIGPVNCMACHKDAPLKHAFHRGMAGATGRDGRPSISCKQCHGTHDVSSPRTLGTRFNASNLQESCGNCHADVKEKFVTSEHARALAAEVKGAPNCLTCHLADLSYASPGQDTLRTKVRQEKMCLSCHLDNPDVRARMNPTTGFIAAYEKSVHGAALLGGNSLAANCVDCHGSHEMKKGFDPTARVSKEHIPQTCSKCHAGIAKEYGESAHGVALAKGIAQAPVCTDCHGEHNILAPTDPRSPVAPKNLSAQVCSPCHSSLKLSEKYGIASDRFKTFSDSYHGLAIRGGSVVVANCASCHGYHGIKSSADPSSPVHKANLATTCGKCHPGANERFGVGSVHVSLAREEEPLLYWVSTIYIIMIVSLIGTMFIHNAADFIRKARRKLMIRRGLPAEEHVSHSLYVRMTLAERFQHGALMLSLIVLVITGFMLRYPDAWWVVGIRNLSSEAFELRSLLHRIAGVVMVAASLFHVYYIAFTERGRALIRDLMPRIQDVRDAVAVLKYNFGFTKTKPKFGRFSYIEKSEYWALVWGTVIMAGTGFIMWFDNTFIGLLTKLGYDVTRLVHFYEAWLATLAILVWHIYYVIFIPDIYPMNLAWLTGTLTEAEMAEEHPLELEEIKRREIGESFVEEVLEEPAEENRRQ